MSDDKPLHVQVAEALGWQDIQSRGDILAIWASGYGGRPPGIVPIIGQTAELHPWIPRYDLEWSATGPLIEKYEIWLRCEKCIWWAWSLIEMSGIAPKPRFEEHGDTPLLAICKLILTLKADGKLENP